VGATHAVVHRASHWLTAVTVVGCTALLAGLSAVPAAAGPAARGSGRAAVPGRQLWASRYNGPGSGIDEASSVAVSPAGGAVFVTGRSNGATSGLDYATVAYNSVTGARLWASRYSGPCRQSGASSLAVSPGGAKVFVTGVSCEDYARVACRADLRRGATDPEVAHRKIAVPLIISSCPDKAAGAGMAARRTGERGDGTSAARQAN
jgi:DNA-binding beta-propeller fold protein YncE